MPRDLSDVLHYFLPELDGAPESRSDSERERRGRPETAFATSPAPVRRRSLTRPETTPLPLSVLGVPIAERDVVHAAFTWNLAIETARHGGASVILAPDSDRDAPLWPAEGPGPLGSEVVYCPARNLAELRRAAAGLAEERSKTARRGGIVFTCIPPAWLADAGESMDPIRWLLLFTSPRRQDTAVTFERVKQLVGNQPGLDVGVTLHGVHRIAEARAAFDELARSCEERLRTPIVSYGLLVDDLDVYRAIAAGRPIGLAYPQAPATRALRDVARLLYEDARSRVLG